MNDLHLFVWHKTLCDYTCGVVVALAHDVDEARRLVLAGADDYMQNYLASALEDKPTIYDAPVGFYVTGGS